MTAHFFYVLSFHHCNAAIFLPDCDDDDDDDEDNSDDDDVDVFDYVDDERQV